MTGECGPTAVLIVVLQLVFIVIAFKTYLVVKSARAPLQKPAPVHEVAPVVDFVPNTGRFHWRLLSAKKSKVWHPVAASRSRGLDFA